jgi:hypothetical protein
MHFVTHGGFRKVDRSVGGNVAIVGEAQTAVVDDRQRGAVGLIGQLADGSVGRDLVKSHAANAHDQIAVAVKTHAERRTADMGKDRVTLVVRRFKADDVAMARAAIEIVVFVKDDVFWALDVAKTDDLDAR